MMKLLAGGVALLSFVVQGQQQTEDPRRALYGKLFTLSQPVIVQGGGEARATVPQRGACNMPMIAGNTQVDPKIVKPIEKGRTDPKIRAIQPSACWGSGQRATEAVVIKK